MTLILANKRALCCFARSDYYGVYPATSFNSVIRRDQVSHSCRCCRKRFVRVHAIIPAIPCESFYDRVRQILLIWQLLPILIVQNGGGARMFCAVPMAIFPTNRLLSESHCETRFAGNLLYIRNLQIFIDVQHIAHLLRSDLNKNLAQHI